MRIPNFKLLTFFTAMVLFVGTLSSCSDDDGPTANITVNEGPSGDMVATLLEMEEMLPERLIGLTIWQQLTIMPT